MKGLQVQHFIGMDALALRDLSDPVEGPGDTLVRVKAVALSRTDIAVLLDHAVEGRDPRVPGVSFAGEVIRGGRYPTATSVAVDPYIACGSCARCIGGYGCAVPRVLGRDVQGGLAELVAVPSAQVVPLPRRIGFVEGAAVAASASIAAKILLDDAAVMPGQRVLVTGSTGSLGLTLMQVARALACEVAALVSRPDRVDLAMRAGASHAVAVRLDGRPPDLDEVGGPVDVVVHLGRDGSWLDQLVHCLRPGGRLIVRRIRPGAQVNLDLGRFAARGYSLVGSTGSGTAGLAEAMMALSSVPTDPVIEAVLPWTELASGFKTLASRANRGAVVVVP